MKYRPPRVDTFERWVQRRQEKIEAWRAACFEMECKQAGSSGVGWLRADGMKEDLALVLRAYRLIQHMKRRAR